MRPVLVTGASGFIGQTLAGRLSASGVAVVGTGRSHPVAVAGVKSTQLDLADPQQTAALFQEYRPSAVVHCAAATKVGFCQQNPKQARRSIVEATRELARAVMSVAPEIPVISISTDLVFDGEQAPYHEDDPAQPVSVYGQLKLEAEMPILDLRQGTVLRTSLVYGPVTTSRPSFLDWMIDTLRANKPLGLFEDEVRTPIYVGDVCDAVRAILRSPLSGLWHMGGPQRLSRVEIGQAVCRVFEFDPGLIQRQKLADSTFEAPRPRDVSLASDRLWTRLEKKPLGLIQGLERLGLPP